MLTQKNKIHQLFFSFLIILFISCDVSTKPFSKNSNIQIKQDSEAVNFRKYFYQKHSYEFYIVMKTTRLEDALFEKPLCLDTLNGHIFYPWGMVECIYFKDTSVYQAVVLFYLRTFLEYFQNNYYPRYICEMDKNPYTPLFYIIFLEISNKTPKDTFDITTCYKFIKKSNKYTDNPDIKILIDSIDFLLSNKKIPDDTLCAGYIDKWQKESKKFNEFYEIIKENEVNDSIFILLKRRGISTHTVIAGMYYNDQTVNKAIILYFLKVYLKFLTQKYYPEYFCDIDYSPFTPVFKMIMLRVMKKPLYLGFRVSEPYKYIKNKDEYIRNQDIKKLIDSISNIEKELKE